MTWEARTYLSRSMLAGLREDHLTFTTLRLFHSSSGKALREKNYPITPFPLVRALWYGQPLASRTPTHSQTGLSSLASHKIELIYILHTFQPHKESLVFDKSLEEKEDRVLECDLPSQATSWSTWNSPSVAFLGVTEFWSLQWGDLPLQPGPVKVCDWGTWSISLQKFFSSFLKDSQMLT